MAKHSRRLIIHPPSMVSSPALRPETSRGTTAIVGWVNWSVPLSPWRDTVGPAVQFAGASMPKNHIIACRVKLTIRQFVLEEMSPRTTRLQSPSAPCSPVHRRTSSSRLGYRPGPYADACGSPHRMMFVRICRPVLKSTPSTRRRTRGLTSKPMSTTFLKGEYNRG